MRVLRQLSSRENLNLLLNLNNILMRIFRTCIQCTNLFSSCCQHQLVDCLTFYIAYVLGQIQHEAAIPQLIEVLYVKNAGIM